KGTLKKYMENPETFAKKLNLVKKINATNMHLYTAKYKIKKYDSPLDILNDYYNVRVEYYEKRRIYQIKKLKIDNELLKWTIKFIKDVINEKIIIAKNTKKKIIERVVELGYPKLATTVNTKDEEDDDDENSKGKSYNYIIKLPLFSLTKDKIDELEKQLKE